MKASSGCLRVLSVFVSVLILLMPVSFAEQLSQRSQDVPKQDINTEMNEAVEKANTLWKSGKNSSVTAFSTSSGAVWVLKPTGKNDGVIYTVEPKDAESEVVLQNLISQGPSTLADKPDLQPGAAIQTEPASPVEGQTIQVFYHTLNPSNIEVTKTFKTALEISTTSGYCIINGMPKISVITCKATIGSSVFTAGPYGMKEIVDSDDKVAESDESNNVLIQTLVIGKPKYDLTVTDLHTEPSIPDDASTFTIIVKVKNIGKNDLKEPFTGTFYFDGVKFPFTHEFGEGAIVGKEYEKNLGGNSFKAGVHTIKFVVDDEGKISETNEGNNAKEISINVKHTAKYDLAISQIYTVPASVNDASAFELKWVVENKGDSIDAELFADSKIEGDSFLRFCDFRPLDDGEGAWLYSGKSYTCTGSLKLAAGSYTATADVELMGPVDADLSNNQRSWSFSVVSSKKVYDCNGVKDSCKDADATGVCVGTVLKCCPASYPHYWNLDDTCHASPEPEKCALPDGSGPGCDCDWSKDCPKSHPYCEQSYPPPVSDGYDACLASEPEYCGNGKCGEGESFEKCEVDCASSKSSVVNIDVAHAKSNAPLRGVGVSVDGIPRGMTDGNGKISFSVSHGTTYFKAECPDTSFCSERTIKVSGNVFMNFRCDCDESVDSDSDGSSDADEKLLGTNPNDADSSYKSAFSLFDYPNSCKDIHGLTKVIWDNKDDLIQGDTLVVNALNSTKVLSTNLETEPMPAISALKTASLNGRIETKSVPTLMQGLETSESLGYLETSNGVILTFTDYDTSSTAIIIIGAVCVGEFIGTLYGAGSGVKDDVIGVWELIKGIWNFGNHPLRAVTETIDFLKEMKLAHFWNGAGMAFTSMLRSILEKGRGVNLFRQDRFDNPESYHAFQLGFFTGFIEGYIAEQILVAVTGWGAILKGLKNGVLLGKAGKSIKLAATLTRITQKFSGEVAGLIKNLKYANKITDWTELEQNGIARLARLKQQKWLNELSEAEAKIAAKHADDILEAGKLTEGQMQNLLTTHLGRETIKLAETTPELLAKQSKLVEKLGADEINKITKKSVFKAFDAERVDGLNKLLKAMPEGVADELTTAKGVKILSNKDVIKGSEELFKFVDKSELEKLAGSLDEFEELADITGRITRRYGSLDEFYPALKACLKGAGLSVSSICTPDEIAKITSDMKKLGQDINSIKEKFGNWVADLTLDGIKLKVIDITKVHPEKLAQVIKGYGKVNPFDPALGERQLVKILKAPGKQTVVGTEKVDGVLVLRRGKMVAKENKELWGVDHIKDKHGEELKEAFGKVLDDEDIKSIAEKVMDDALPPEKVISTDPDIKEAVEKVIEYNGKERKVRVAYLVKAEYGATPGDIATVFLPKPK